MSNKKLNKKSKRTARMPARKRNILIALAAFCIIAGALVLVKAFAGGATYTMRRGVYNLEAIAAKYSKTSIATVASSAGSALNTGSSCQNAWGKAPKAKFSYEMFCWHNADVASGWKQQGITGSGSARSNSDGGNKNILLVSWYTNNRPTTVASGNDDPTRLTVVNNKTKKYTHVELVKPCNSGAKICNLGSHGGGVAWAGDYLYLASTTGLYVFNVNDVYVVGGKPVLLAKEVYVLNYTRKNGELSARISSVSFDPVRNQLVTVEFREHDSAYKTTVMRWGLDSGRHLGWGKSVVTTSSFKIGAEHVQGAASSDRYYLAASSSERISGYNSNTAVLFSWKSGGAVSRIRMPWHIESVYADDNSRRVWSLTEPGSHSSTQFVFSFDWKSLPGNWGSR